MSIEIICIIWLSFMMILAILIMLISTKTRKEEYYKNVETQEECLLLEIKYDKPIDEPGDPIPNGDVFFKLLNSGEIKRERLYTFEKFWVKLIK